MLVYFFVYIFAIYFIYIDKRDCELFSHAECDQTRACVGRLSGNH